MQSMETREVSPLLFNMMLEPVSTMSVATSTGLGGGDSLPLHAGRLPKGEMERRQATEQEQLGTFLGWRH